MLAVRSTWLQTRCSAAKNGCAGASSCTIPINIWERAEKHDCATNDSGNHVIRLNCLHRSGKIIMEAGGAATCCFLQPPAVCRATCPPSPWYFSGITHSYFAKSKCALEKAWQMVRCWSGTGHSELWVQQEAHCNAGPTWGAGASCSAGVCCT